MTKTAILWMSALALIGCATQPDSSGTPAPAIGKADGPGSDQADTACQIVLRTAGRVTSDTFQGTIDVNSQSLATGTTVGVMYSADGAGWEEVAATESTAGHFTFAISSDATEQLELVPLLHTPSGGRVFDHNRNSDPFSNSLRDAASSWTIANDPSVCAASSADHDCRVVLRSVTNNVTRQGTDGSIVWDGTLDVRSDVALAGAPQVEYETNIDQVWTVAVATASATSPIAGYQRYTFSLDHDTVRAGSVDGYLWDQLVVQLIPSIETAGTQWFDHNFANTPSTDNPDGNYILTQELNDTQYSAPASVCPAR